MDIDVETEQRVAYVPTRIPPATFRGTDCAQLAERYAAYRRNMGLDMAQHDPDVVIPVAAVVGNDA